MTTEASHGAAPRNALVTGAAGGIGRALVSAFTQAGFRVIASDLCPRPVGLPCARYVEADLARLVDDPSYAEQTLVSIRDFLADDGLTALINNAAVQILNGTEQVTRGDWQRTLNVNLISPFLLVQALLPHLEAARGCVVNVSSIHARLTKRNFVAYATSKAALSGMTRALAVDLGARVRVNAIEPAAIETEMLLAGFAGKPEAYSGLQACHPQARIGTASEVANLALAIVQGGMPFLHGACIGIDGGISARLFDPD